MYGGEINATLIPFTNYSMWLPTNGMNVENRWKAQSHKYTSFPLERILLKFKLQLSL
jgi:hypothetical protein